MAGLINKVVSGGQTGVDRAALDVARTLGMVHGGWCPSGRLAEDGIIPPEYPLHETPSAEYAQRTRWNVRDSDGTLVLTMGRSKLGTALTIDVATRLNKPYLVVDLINQPCADVVRRWARDHHIRILNVAGPRESTSPGIYTRAKQFLSAVFAANSHPAS
ncbi:MAG TPA: putative molybdenum carrier protein [Nitrospiraceae bacterium]|nr:putative molybdenum carrier protein [Nitrospiraceae bacterium]